MTLESGGAGASSPSPAARVEAQEVQLGGPEAADSQLPEAVRPSARTSVRAPDRLRPAEARDVPCPDGALHVVAWRDSEGRIRRIVRTFSGPGGRRSESVDFDEKGHPLGVDGEPLQGVDPSESFRNAACP
jgi:hypothetical protein